MFKRYAIHPHMIRSSHQTPDWEVELKRGSLTGEISPADRAPVLSGDPNDGLPLGLTEMGWGIPNQWMARKGLDPFDHPLLSMSLEQGFSPPGAGTRFAHCLIPVTSIIVGQRTRDVGLRDPDRPVLTLAGVVDGEYFCFLTQEVTDSSRIYDAPLVVAPENHGDWMCGWGGDKRTCCNPLLISRMVVGD